MTKKCSTENMWKSAVSLGLLALIVAISGSSAFAMDSDTKAKLKRDALNVIGYALEPSDGAPLDGVGGEPTVGQYIGATNVSTSLGCLTGGADVVGEPLHGLVMGCTYYDYQKNGTMGRQIATDQIFHVLNFTWMNQSNNSATQGRNVRYEGFSGGALGDGTGGVDVAGPATDPNERSGYVTMVGVSDGTALNAHHWSRIFQTDANTFTPYVFKNETQGLPDFSGFGGVSSTGQVPDSIWNVFSETGDQRWYWPQIAYTDIGGTQVAHLLLHVNQADERFIYTRRVGNGEWEPAFFVGYNPELTPTVAHSRTSERVAITWGGFRGDGTANNCSVDRRGVDGSFMDNDMYYMASEDAGATWGSCVNITQFPDSSAGSFRVFAHLTGIFDSNDDFHVAWTAIRYSGWGLGAERLARILHWDEVSQSVRTAVDGVWEIELCEGGDFQANVDQPQLSECAGKLYLTFVMFAPGSLGLEDDCGERAFPPLDAGHAAANGEIYVTVSDNNGFNWDPPRNLTQSYTPDCDTFPDAVKEDCHSNNWLSTTRYGIDITLDNFFAVPDFTTRIDPSHVVDAGEYLFTQYVDDADPGGAIRGNGGWQDNPLRVFRFGCVDIVEAAVLGSSIPEGQAIDDPTFTLPGTSETFDWELSNIGNTLLTYTLSINNQTPANNITITGTTPSIDAGELNTNDLVVTLNAGLETTVQHAHAEVTITGNFVNGQTAGTMFFNIDYTIGDIQQRVEDSIASCLIFDNRGNIGDQSEPGLSMDVQGSTSECDTLATSYLFDGSPIISYPGSGGNITVSGMFNNGFVDSFLFRPLNDPSNDALSDDDWYLGTSNEFTTYDSTLGLTVDYWAPKASNLSDDWKVVYGRLCVTNRTLSTVNDVYVAYAWDWDVYSDHTAPNNVDNTSGFLADNSWNMMYQQGANDTTTTCLENDKRFAAVRYFPPGEIDTLDAFASGSGLAGAVGFQALYTRDNATFVGADWDYRALDSMLLNISGFDAFTTVDPELIDGTDLHMVLNGGSLNLGVNDTAYLHFAMITGIAADNTTSDLEGIAEEMKTWSPWTAGTCCNVAGDANNDESVTIGDVTFLIARIFSGGGPPPCCSEGDANGDGAITIGDVTYLIARIFSGGGAPICGPAGMTCGAN